MALTIGVNACDSDSSSGTSGTDADAFEVACVNSGGKTDNSICVCNNTPCASGILCNTVTKECAFTPECEGTWKKCTIANDGIGYSQECNNGSLSTKTICPGNAVCEDDTKCKELNTAPCTKEGEIICKDGKTKTCVNGQYTEEVTCPGNTNCKDATQCEPPSTDKCDGSATECIEKAGVGQIRSCIGGSWTEYTVCPGGACNDNHDDCKATTSEDCTENVCNNGKLKKCIANKFSNEINCENSNGCKSASECGECKYISSEDLDKLCTDNGNGCSYKQCTSAFTWSNTDEHSDLSCTIDNHLGNCRNGYYNITKGDETKDSIIQSCQNGVWPLDNPNSTTSWTNNDQNDALFRFALTCKQSSESVSEIHLYSNFTKDIYTTTSSAFKCESLKNDSTSFVLPKRTNIFESQSGNINFLSNFLTMIYGASNDDSWFMKDGLFKWFNCGNRNCLGTSICIDVVALTDSTLNVSSNPYIVTITDSRYVQEEENSKTIYEFKKENGECNSNRTGIHNAETCSQFAIDMMYLSNTDTSSDACSSDPICLKENIEFNICRFGAVRSVKCKIDATESYVCTFDTPDKSFDTETVCIDFYDKANRHYAYKFTADTTNKSTATFTKCTTNRCNKNWTGCSDDAEL